MAIFRNAFRLFLVDYIVRRTGRGDEDIRILRSVAEVRKRNGFTAKALCLFFRLVERAIRHENALHTFRLQVRCRKLTHFTGAKD